MSKLVNIQNEHKAKMHSIVSESAKEEEIIMKKLREDSEEDAKRSFGEVLSDKIASFGGSWTFIILFFIFLAFWMLYGSLQGAKAFDPYPYIFLNLILSCIAAIQAPVILMSQNRKETRDRKRGYDDYLINLKAELENRITNQKLDLIINLQFKELIDIQEMQLERIDNLERLLKSSSKQKESLELE